MTIYVVVTQGRAWAAYKNPTHAWTHARTITGAEVVDCELLDCLPAEVTSDINSEDWDASETPVEIPVEVAERLRVKR
jgi:hypothetical protein